MLCESILCNCYTSQQGDKNGGEDYRYHIWSSLINAMCNLTCLYIHFLICCFSQAFKIRDSPRPVLLIAARFAIIVRNRSVLEGLLPGRIVLPLCHFLQIESISQGNSAESNLHWPQRQSSLTYHFFNFTFYVNNYRAAVKTLDTNEISHVAYPERAWPEICCVTSFLLLIAGTDAIPFLGHRLATQIELWAYEGRANIKLGQYGKWCNKIAWQKEWSAETSNSHDRIPR